MDSVYFPSLPQRARLDPRLAEGVCPWLGKYIHFSKRSSLEGYVDYHTFCAIMVLSTIAAKRVWLPMAGENIYTNLYILICGPSTKFAKSTTAKVWRRVMEELGLNDLFYQIDITVAKLINKMSGRVPSDYADLPADEQARVRQEIAWASAKCLYHDEFGEVLKSILQENSTMREMQKFLLEGYDGNNPLARATIARGDEGVANPYIGVLGIGVPDTLQNVFKKGADAWKSGLMARTSYWQTRATHAEV